MKRSSFLYLAAMIIGLSGCSQIKTADYSGFTNIGIEGMPTDWVYEFSPFSPDSTLNLPGVYDVVIAVRYTNNCPSQSVIFNIEQFSLAHEHPDSSRVEIPLFDKEGTALGKNRYGINEITDTIRRGYRIPEGYTLSLSSPLPTESTAGIQSVGLVIVDQTREKYLFW